MGVFKEYVRGGIPFAQRINPTNGPTVYKKVAATFEDQLNLTTEGAAENQISSRVDDLKRIATLLTQPPGLKYIANETLLRTSTTKKTTQEKIQNNNGTNEDVLSSGLKGKLSQLGAGLLGTAAVLGSTLAQIPLNGTGTHFVRGFRGTSRHNYLSSLDTPPHVLAQEGKPIITNQIAQEGKEFTDDEVAGGTFLDPNYSLLGAEKFTQLSQTFIPRDVKDSVKKDVRAGLGKPSNNSLTTYDSFDKAQGAHDQINMLGVLSEDSEIKDLIKFKFRVIHPQEDGSDDRFLIFRAYLENFSDNFSADWNSWKYSGRAENFYTYNGFSREVSLSFKVSAQTRGEMKSIYQKIAYLASTTAPTYGTYKTMKGTFVRLTVGDYLDNMPGFINNIDFSWDQSYPWEIALKPEPNAGVGGSSLSDIDKDQQQLPMVLDVNLNFTVIHDFRPETGLLPYMTAKLKDSNPASIIPEVKQTTGYVEIGEGAFGGDFDQGNYVDITNIEG